MASLDKNGDFETDWIQNLANLSVLGTSDSARRGFADLVQKVRTSYDGLRQIEAAAENRFRAHRWSEAAIGFLIVAELEPGRKDLLRKSGDSLLRANRYEQALAPLRRIASDPEFVRRSQFATLNLGRCLVGLGRWQEALEPLEQARKLKPEFPGTHLALAKAYLGLGEIEEFESHLARLSELEPGQPDTVFLDALRRARRGGIAQALERLSGQPEAPRLRILEVLLQTVHKRSVSSETIRPIADKHAALLAEALRLFSAFDADFLVPLIPWLQATGDLATLDAWVARIEAEGETLLTPEACRSIAQARVATGRFDEASLWMQRAQSAADSPADSTAVKEPAHEAFPSFQSSADETDIGHAVRLLLCRERRSGEDWQGWIGRPLGALLEHLLLSEEFRADVLPQLDAVRDPQAGQAGRAADPHGTSAWAARRLPLLRETVAAVHRTSDPLVRLKLVLGDPDMAHRLASISSVDALRRVQIEDRVVPSGVSFLVEVDSVDWETLLNLPPQGQATVHSGRWDHFRNVLEASKPAPGNLGDLLALLQLYRKEFGGDAPYVELLAKCLVELKMFDRLLVLCGRALDQGIAAAEAYWYKSIAEDKLGLLDEAVISGLMALASLSKPSPNRTIEIGRLAFRSSHGSLGKYPARPAHALLARDLFLQARLFGRHDGVPEYELARMALWRGARDEAIANASAAVTKKPDSKNVRLLAHCYLYFGEYAQAADLVAGYDFKDDPFLFIKRLVARFGTPESEAGEPNTFRDPSGAALDLSRLPVNPGSLSNVGEIQLVSDDAPDFPIRFQNLALWSPVFDMARRNDAGLVTLTCRNAQGTSTVELALNREHQSDGVLLASKAGKTKFGGAEHFLYQAAEEYRARGLAPAFLGIGELPEDPGGDDDLPCTWVAPNVEAIRSGIVARAPKIVHSVTGLGLEVMEALKGSSVYHVHGVHFWRDFKFSRAQPENSWFQDVETLPIRQEFNAVLTGHGTVYVNSEYTRDLVRSDFGVTLPVVPSVAPETGAPGESKISEEAERDVVLLVNSRRDKGGYFVLEIAEKLPQTRFVLIRSQDQSERMALEIQRRDLSNIELLDRVDDMQALYRRTRVALVPSFDFVESFSRVPIEAHRHGIPVIGAEVGNVARLLETPGISLPRDAGAWAAEISKLFSDPDYYTKRSEAALESSRRWSYEAFQEGIDRLARAQKAPILVAVGTGLGNMLHTTPAIEWLSRYFDAPVDIVMSGDWDEADRLFAGSPFVNMIFPLDNRILTKPYKSVFVLHSFGDGRYDFTAETVHYSREWRRFDPAGPLHERDFNIEFAAAALGVDVSASLGSYFLGDRSYIRSQTCRRIGLHAGSKANHWAIKRWPYFAELAAELTSRGYEVVSFGGPAEGVEFSQQLTGLPLDRSVDEIMRCDYFISNDSGVMNIANALGVPQAALFAPTNPATRGPVNADSLIIQVDKDCSPCETKRELYGDMISKGGCACMRELSLDLVLAKVLEHIDRVYG